MSGTTAPVGLVTRRDPASAARAAVACGVGSNHAVASSFAFNCWNASWGDSALPLRLDLFDDDLILSHAAHRR